MKDPTMTADQTYALYDGPDLYSCAARDAVHYVAREQSRRTISACVETLREVPTRLTALTLGCDENVVEAIKAILIAALDVEP